MPIRLFGPQYWPTWLALGLLRLFALIPFTWALHLGGALGSLLRYVPMSGVRTARRNTRSQTMTSSSLPIRTRRLST